MLQCYIYEKRFKYNSGAVNDFYKGFITSLSLTHY